MAKKKRKSDSDNRSRFQTNRFFQHGGQWFFQTREGTTEGPFEDIHDARNRLETYLKVMKSELVPKDSPLARNIGLAPKD